MIKQYHPTRMSYTPSKTLVNYLNKKLHLFKLEKRRIESGLELSSEDKKRKRENDRMKVHILNRHVFQAMANLTIFLEHAARLELELGKAEIPPFFEDDIRELLFGVKYNDFDKHPHVFYRFLSAALSWSVEKDPNNFRLELIHTLQQIVYAHLSTLSFKELSDDVTNNVISPDVGRVYVWTKLYASRVKKRNKNDEVHRPVLF
jgi:hypothetical protein